LVWEEEEESFGVDPRALVGHDGQWQWQWLQQEPGSRMRQSRPAVFVADLIQVSIQV
jgi:hypothetical protein